MREDGQDSKELASSSSSLFRRLIEACKLKDLPTIRSILGAKPNLANQKDRNGRSLLHYAAILVVRQETNTNTNTNNSIECFQLVVDRCDPRLWWHQDLDGLSVLHLAVICSNLSLVEHLILASASAAGVGDDDSKLRLVCAADNELHTPLHWAVITGSLASVRLLVSAGGVRLCHEPDLNGATPLHYATQSAGIDPKCHRSGQLRRLLAGRNDAGARLLEMDDDDAAQRHQDNQEVLKKTQTASDVAILEFMCQLDGIQLECRDKDERTPLLWAASSGNRHALLVLLQNRAQPMASDLNGLGALHCAASHGHCDCLESLLLSKVQKVDPNQADKLNCTALFYAIMGANVDCLELLIEHGADANWQDSKGRTAAHFGALKGQLQALRVLRERGGANLWLANKLGDLPLHYAIRSGRQQVVRWLLEQSPYEQAVNAINNLGRAPIHLAVQRNNLPMAAYLIQCGANLNQLAKVRSGSNAQQQQHYETALDMAQRLRYPELVELLDKHSGQPAAQVLANRHQRNPTLFQALEADSPIGFETSCSSASPAAASQPANRQQQQQDQESSGSSALSHSSVASLRVGKPCTKLVELESHPIANQGQNEHICASIKCELYPQRFDRDRSQPKQVNTGELEPIAVANVNLYASPCANCLRAGRSINWPNKCVTCRSKLSYSTKLGADFDSGDTDFNDYNDDSPDPDIHLPPLGAYDAFDVDMATRQQSSLIRRQHLPSHRLQEELRLPVILSEREQSTTPSGSDLGQPDLGTTTNEQEKPQAGRRSAARSPAEEEPRFDRFSRESCGEKTSSNTRRSRSHGGSQRRSVNATTAKSPVGEYIRGHQFGSPVSAISKRPNKVSTSTGRQHGLSKVSAKVDSRRRSVSPQHQQGSKSINAQQTRSMSRQTIIKTRRLSVDSVELASKVEKAIRKYKQETKLFEELQLLKRSQIRSGRANEALLVKRLVEHLRRDTQHLMGLDSYQGPYTYKAYERFLYDQLRKLSLSNRAKLSPQHHLDRHHDLAAAAASMEDSNLRAQDDEAELELRRIVSCGGNTGGYESEDETLSSSYYLEPTRATEEIRVKPRSGSEAFDKSVQRQSIHDANDRDANEQCLCGDLEDQVRVLDQVLELKSSAGLDTRNHKRSNSLEEEVASSLSEAIVVDALGNLSRSPSVASGQVVPKDDEKLADQNSKELEGLAEKVIADEHIDEQTTETPSSPVSASSSQRRRSVINIGNKMDVVYHDVGIEIEPAPEMSKSSSEEEEENSDKSNHNSAKLEGVPEEQQVEVETKFQKDSTQEPLALGELKETSEIKLRRRESSPPIYGKSEQKQKSPLIKRQRAASVESTTSMIASREPRKVFNGHDLDEMSNHNKRRKQSETYEDDSNISETSKTSRQVSPSFRRHLVRSEANRIKYVPPQVSPERIKQRWDPIRARGRRALVCGESNSNQVGVWLDSQSMSMQQENKLAKSQPNLNSNLKQNEVEEEENGSTQVNYILLYEINKRRQVNNQVQVQSEAITHTDEEHKRQQVDWCHKRLVRIVDVRSIKRTLSLPETVLYSNDLLKRFNILKL